MKKSIKIIIIIISALIIVAFLLSLFLLRGASDIGFTVKNISQSVGERKLVQLPEISSFSPYVNLFAKDDDVVFKGKIADNYVATQELLKKLSHEMNEKYGENTNIECKIISQSSKKLVVEYSGFGYLKDTNEKEEVAVRATYMVYGFRKPPSVEYEDIG